MGRRSATCARNFVICRTSAGAKEKGRGGTEGRKKEEKLVAKQAGRQRRKAAKQSEHGKDDGKEDGLTAESLVAKEVARREKDIKVSAGNAGK